MTTSDFSTNLLVDQTPTEALGAILNMRGWWSEEIEGDTDKLNAIFKYHYKDIHYCEMKMVTLIPDKKVAWLVLDNRFSFIEDQREWVNSQLTFDISRKGNKTEIKFTHVGLSPEDECYDVCQDGWNNYIKNSLRNFITTGKGQPNLKEGGFNADLAKKWNIETKVA